MPKNIVVFSDGTGQEGGIGYNTNIYKMFNMIEDRTPRQVVFYDPGLGTDWRKFTGNIAGMGISRNIQDCYSFIFNNYEAGDKIYLFGFSRGAATVRSLSGFIHYFGILPASRPKLIKRAYNIYEITNEAKRIKAAAEFIGKNHTMWVRIHFIGCYDTVAALGLPNKFLDGLLNLVPFFRHNFHNFRLSESVENAIQALAIDDERAVFHPVLWDKEIFPYQTMQQVWFCGMHTDVGGGYKEQELAGIPLTWMLQKAVEKGLLIYQKNKVQITEDPNGIMHDSRGTLMAKLLYWRKIRSWDRIEKPVIHESVLERKKNQKNEDLPYKPWILDREYEVEPWVPLQKQSWFKAGKNSQNKK